MLDKLTGIEQRYKEINQELMEVGEDYQRAAELAKERSDMEPIIRDADLMSFDITSIKSSDAPGNKNAQPFGLTGEEACQICWYAGLNEKMSSVGFYEYNPEADDEHMNTAAVTATMIWYFIEGFYHRKDESNFRGNDYLRFVVSMPADPENLTFYKSIEKKACPCFKQ